MKQQDDSVKDSVITDTTILSSDSDTRINEYDASDNSDSINFSLKKSETSSGKELLYILKNTGPVLITFLFQYLIQIMIPIYFEGKLGTISLSACSLAITSFYLSGPAFFNGFATSLDTLCSAAFGAGNYTKVGLYYQRCSLILLFASVPMMTFWFFPRPILRMMTDDVQLIDLCEKYLSYMPLAAPAIAIFECSKRFLQSQNKFSAPTRINIVALPLSLVLNALLFPKLRFQGPPIVFVITYWFMCISLILYVFFVDGYQCWNTNISVKNLFSNWAIFYKLGVPGVLMVLSEAFAFQVITIMSTRFGTKALAAQSVVSTLASFAFQFPFAVGICCTTRIANIIGSQSSDYKVAMHIIIRVAGLLSVVNFCWMYLFRYQLASLFTQDPALINEICHLLLIVGFNQFLDCFNVICAAVLRGQGRQKLGSLLSLFSYYIIGAPLEILLGFYFKMKVFGLWLGLALAVSFLTISEVTVVLNSDWLSIIRRCSKLT